MPASTTRATPKRVAEVDPFLTRRWVKRLGGALAAHRYKYLQRHFNVKAPRLKKRFRNIFQVFVATHPLAKTS